jgi:hypothetical protein
LGESRAHGFFMSVVSPITEVLTLLIYEIFVYTALHSSENSA